LELSQNLFSKLIMKEYKYIVCRVYDSHEYPEHWRSESSLKKARKTKKELQKLYPNWKFTIKKNTTITEYFD